MINPSIETDLVGDIIEVYDRPSFTTEMACIGAGRCRAVTADRDGHLMLWLEILDDKQKAAWAYVFAHRGAPLVGDVMAISTASFNDSTVPRILRLVKDYR